MILVVGVDGKVEEHGLPDGTVGFLGFCYEKIDCDLIDRIRLSDNIDMWVDDEGMWGQEVNVWATIIANRFGYPIDCIFGGCIITGTKWTMDGPSAWDLSEEEMKEVKEKITWKK